MGTLQWPHEPRDDGTCSDAEYRDPDGIYLEAPDLPRVDLGPLRTHRLEQARRETKAYRLAALVVVAAGLLGLLTFALLMVAR